MESNQSSFWQFSDSIRLGAGGLSNLSLDDSIWSDNYSAKRTVVDRRNFNFRNDGEGEDAGRRNFEGPVGSPLGLVNDIESDLERLNLGFINDGWKSPVNDNRFINDDWKAPVKNSVSTFDDWKGPINDSNSRFGNGFGWKNAITMNDGVSRFKWNDGVPAYGSKTGLNGGFNKGISTYSGPSVNVKSYSKSKNGFVNNAVVDKDDSGFNGGGGGGRYGKKNKGYKESNGNGNIENKNPVDKRFKTLPPTESLSRNERIGGYIFVCNNDTMAENLKRQLFGMPNKLIPLHILASLNLNLTPYLGISELFVFADEDYCNDIDKPRSEFQS